MNLKAPATLRIDAVFALATLGLTSAAVAVAAWPHLVRTEPTPQEQGVLVEERQNTAKALGAELDGLEKKLAALQEQSNRAVQLQPPSAANIRLGDLAAAAEANGATVVQISSLAPDSLDSRATVIPIRMAGLGTYGQVTGFLGTLAEKFRDTGVTAFKMSGGPAMGNPPPAAQFTLELAWFAAPAGPAAPAGRAGRAGSAGAGGK